MRVPRWATYPAIAILLLLAVIAFPRAARHDGAAQRLRTRAVAPLIELPTKRAEVAGELALTDFLPSEFVTDGSVDYRAEVQTAIEAAAGQILVLPDFPIQVGRATGQTYGLIVRAGMTLRGSNASKLFTHESALQLLRVEGVSDLLLDGFHVEGPGGDGESLGHGLIQITGAERVHVRGLRITQADADGVAIAQASSVRVEGLMVEQASKSAIYLAACKDAIVRDNFVRDFGGHRLEFGKRVGVGIQLSSCRDVLCTQNKIQDGLGVGILCNAFQGGDHPDANTLTGNQISGVANPQNQSVSGGIRLANGNHVKTTRTHVRGNTITGCGTNGIYIENHGGSTLAGNLIQDSEQAGILISNIAGVEVTKNVVIDSGGGRPAIESIHHAQGVRLEGNVTGN